MRLGLIPESLLERAGLRLNLAPQPIMLGMWGMGYTRVLLAGVRLGVFEAIGNGPRTIDEVAWATGCSRIGTETLLNALNGFGLLKRRDGRYSNRPTVCRWLLDSSRFPMKDVACFFYDLWDALGGVEEAVRTGHVDDFHRPGKPPEAWERYLRALGTLAKLASIEVVRRVQLPRKSKRLLDVGGGHGVYSAAFCGRYPGLEAVILDLPEAVAVGQKMIEDQGFRDRIQFKAGDLRVTDWGTGFDAVLIFNILHNISPEAAETAIRSARSALRPGGVLTILESEHRGGDNDLSMVGGYNELFFYMITGARAYPEEMIRGWMSGTGFHRITTRRMLSIPGAVLLGGVAT